MGVEFVVLVPGSVEIEDLVVDYQEFKRSRRKPMGSMEPFTAISRLTASIRPGEIVALLGRNGAGKSTLLKCISGFIRPSSGEVKTSGRVFLLAGSDPGLIPALSGMENARELGIAYGIKREEVDDFVTSVKEFADLGGGFDRRVKGYSTGMRGKLGFGIITALKPDILLIDETLGVGDREFRARAQIRLREFIGRSGTVLISTHSLGLAKELCSRGVLLEDGKIEFEGGIQEAIDRYISITD